MYLKYSFHTSHIESALSRSLFSHELYTSQRYLFSQNILSFAIMSMLHLIFFFYCKHFIAFSRIFFQVLPISRVVMWSFSRPSGILLQKAYKQPPWLILAPMSLQQLLFELWSDGFLSVSSQMTTKAWHYQAGTLMQGWCLTLRDHKVLNETQLFLRNVKVEAWISKSVKITFK